MSKQLGEKVKKDFPIFKNNPGLVFLDSGASSQKPQAVIDAEKNFYETYYANVHRGIYRLSEKASEAFEGARVKVQKFINASSIKEVVFTRNTTESINLVSYTWGRQNIERGDEIVITEIEHHANLIPWQILAREKGAQLKFWPVNNNGRLDLNELKSLIDSKTKLVALTHMSNVLGTINPVAEIIKAIRQKSQAKILVDGAQSVPHFSVDMKEIDADWYVFSSHKMLGPTGVGVLYGKEEVLNSMPPFMSGGDMISNVTFGQAEWNELPWKFEAGTPHIGGVIGLGAAIDYLNTIGMGSIQAYEEEITKLALAGLKKISELTIYGPQEPRDRGAVFAFTIKGIHPHDISSILDEQGIAIRSGFHCAQPLHEKLGLTGSSRASFYLYNTLADIQALVRGIIKAKEVFKI